MSGNERFAAIRKGLLEFLILKIISADKVYVADMLVRLGCDMGQGWHYGRPRRLSSFARREWAYQSVGKRDTC